MKMNWGILAVVLLVSLALMAGLFLSLQYFARTAFAPLYDANSQVQTQVANMLHPTPTILPNPVTIIRQINTLARLETIQYTVEKIITAEVGQELFGELFGDRLLFVAHGEVIAGVDMSKLALESLDIQEGLLTIKLPPAEVFTVRLDNEKSYVYNRETGLFTQGNKDLETLARQAAEDEILKAALEDGILEQAQVNAEAYLLRFLNSLGFPAVVFNQTE